MCTLEPAYRSQIFEEKSDSWLDDGDELETRGYIFSARRNILAPKHGPSVNAKKNHGASAAAKGADVYCCKHKSRPPAPPHASI